MPEPEEVRFACIGCGAWNDAGAEVCAGCGHRFAGPDLAANPAISTPPPRPRTPYEPPSGLIASPPGYENPYAPPSSPIGSPGGFRIGTALFLIAVVAVCLGAFRADISLGALVTLSILPAAIRTPLVVRRRRSEGRPMEFPEQLGSFLTTMCCSWAVGSASAVAFVVTCFPVGLVSQRIEPGLAVGIPVALAVAILLTIAFLKMGKNRAAKDRGIRYR